MDEYKEYLAEKLSAIPYHPNRYNDEESFVITDAGWERLKNDPEYEKWLLDGLAIGRASYPPLLALDHDAALILAILYILNTYGIDTKSLVAGIGIAGVVIGLALQDLLKDLISGLSIIVDNYFVIGDIVEFDGFMGEVVEFGLKSTKIRSYTGETLTIANRNIDRIKNLSQKSSNIFLIIPTAYEFSEDKVKKALDIALKEIISNTDADEESCYLGIDEFASSSINYIIKIHCPQDKRIPTKRAALSIIKKVYDDHKIKIPYNQIEVHNAK